MYTIPACTELKTDLAVQYVQQAKQVEALIDNLPEKQDVGPIVSKLTTRCELSHRLDTLLCDLLYPIRSRLRYCQNDRLKALDVEMKTANEEYKSALDEAGQSRPVPLNIGRVAKQRIPGSGLNDTSHHRGSGKGGQGVIGPDVSRLVSQQYPPLRLGRAASSWHEQLWSTWSIDCIKIAGRYGRRLAESEWKAGLITGSRAPSL